MEKNTGRLFPLAVQLTLPRQEDDAAFHRKLAQLQRLGFFGVELNVNDVHAISPMRLGGMLDSYGLRLTRVATGGMAQRRGLSLSHPEKEEREKAQQGMRELMEYAEYFGAELILGFIKGGPGDDKAEAQKRLTESLAALEPYVLQAHTRLILEATNRYEASAVNSLSDAAQVIGTLDRRAFGMLPDTFHMNIEERDMAASLMRYREDYTAVHLSDNNRYYPGLGAIDFSHIIRVLMDCGFRGYLGIEGNLLGSFEEDISLSAAMLDGIFSRLSHSRVL